MFVLPLSDDRKPVSFLQTQFNEQDSALSSDGRWIAYASNESGTYEVYVAPFPSPGVRTRVSVSGGQKPRWRGDGREIFYLAPDGMLMAVAMSGNGPNFDVGAAKALFQTRATTGNDPYDVTADGQRFLVNSAIEDALSAPITVVVDWTAKLQE